MTRINLVDVTLLADQHLFAEWREIKMVPAALRRSLRTRSMRDIISGIPKKYTLNKGHVTFHYDKMKFLNLRYELLSNELLRRNYKLSTHGSFDQFTSDLPSAFKVVDWVPSDEEVGINVERIVERINQKPKWYRYHGRQVEYGYFENLYGVKV